MTDEPTEEEAEAIAAFIGRAAAEAMRREDFAAFRAWVERELPDGLPRLESEAESEEGLRAGANAVATTVWNASPLPSNGYRPRPLPPPGRNDPCPCGSGRKFKRCCGRVAPAWPSLPEEDLWGVLVPHLTKGELRRFASDPALPPGPLGLVALEMKDRGQARAARTALARRLERVEDLDARDEQVLEILFDLESDARDVEDFIPWASGFADRLPRPLDAVAFRYLVTAALSFRRTDVAHLHLDRLRQSRAEDPALGPLEVMTLLAEGELARASERARFWLAKLRRRGVDEEMPEAVEMLEDVARDPEEAARKLREAGTPFLGELAHLVEKAAARPVRPYVLSPADADAVFDRPPPGVREAERAWRAAWPEAKPFLVSLDVALADGVTEEPERWLDVLRKRPGALDGLDVLDDLAFLAAPAAQDLDPGWDRSLLGPLLDRAAAIVRVSMAAAPEAERIRWVYLENRPALRLLSRLAYRLADNEDEDEAAAVLEQMLVWNPDDNHGHREWLINHYLRRGDDARALAIADRFPDDGLVETRFGRGLALWRLGRREEAKRTLADAAADRPLVVEALLAEEMAEPDLDPGFVTAGGEDEAWLYRENLRETWLATPDAIACLRALPKPAPRRRRTRRGRP